MPNLRTFTKSCIQHAAKRVVKRRSVWICTCGYTVTKKNASLSGYPSGNKGFHAHCPKCGKIVAQFIDPKNAGSV